MEPHLISPSSRILYFTLSGALVGRAASSEVSSGHSRPVPWSKASEEDLSPRLNNAKWQAAHVASACRQRHVEILMKAGTFKDVVFVSSSYSCLRSCSAPSIRTWFSSPCDLGSRSLCTRLTCQQVSPAHNPILLLSFSLLPLLLQIIGT